MRDAFRSVSLRPENGPSFSSALRLYRVGTAETAPLQALRSEFAPPTDATIEPRDLNPKQNQSVATSKNSAIVLIEASYACSELIGAITCASAIVSAGLLVWWLRRITPSWVAAESYAERVLSPCETLDDPHPERGCPRGSGGLALRSPRRERTSKRHVVMGRSA